LANDSRQLSGSAEGTANRSKATNGKRSGLRILFADDECVLRELMKSELPRMGHQVTVCADGNEAVRLLTAKQFDVAILDIRMPGRDGIQVLREAKKISPQTEVLLLTGHATVETAVDALRLGAFDYLTKPCRWAELESRLSQIAEKRRLMHQAIALQRRLEAAEGPTRLVGSSEAIQAVRRFVQTVGPADSTVLIMGETGTGKELVARALHETSPRAKMPFVPVNCGALPENLVESELFGHRKGAFTGADQHRKGLFEVADGGTLFLDEVGELDKAIQVKLLRFLESGEIRRVGENDMFTVDVRVICATNRDLEKMVAEGKFRQDLYFRINTFEIELAPLRQRRQDIPELAEHLLARRFAGRGTLPALTPEAMTLLQNYDWPGNVRELANVVEHAAILAGLGTIGPEHLPRQIRNKPRQTQQTNDSASDQDSRPRTLREVEMDDTIKVLKKHGGHKPSGGKELGVSVRTRYHERNRRKGTT